MLLQVTKSRTAVQTAVDMAIPCGIKDAQYFGELFMEIGPDTVKTPGECKQICVDHVDEGCATWKWYGETSHCFLQRDVFEGTDPDGELIPKGALDTDRATYRPRSARCIVHGCASLLADRCQTQVRVVCTSRHSSDTIVYRGCVVCLKHNINLRNVKRKYDAFCG